MWAIRFLNGKYAGQTFPLQNGTYLMGRSEECQIILSETGVSKKHIELKVHPTGVEVVDLKSSNGTFVNGVKVKESDLQTGDKVSVCKTIFDIVSVEVPAGAAEQGAYPPPPQGGFQVPAVAAPGGPVPPPAAAYGGPGAQHPPVPAEGGGPPSSESPTPLTLKNWFNNYMDKVVLPGIYKLPELVDFKWVIVGFLTGFVLVMTSLSALPLISILQSSVEQESLNHAESIATTLAQMNREPVQNQMFSATSVEYAQGRPGVEKAYIINAVDGRIIAPPEQAHSHPQEPFINQARRKNKVSVKRLNSNTVAAMVPIQFYNTKTDTHSAYAYAAVLYNLGTLSKGNEDIISLLVIVFFLSFLIGTPLFWFLYKMIEYPIVSINHQLSEALKDETRDIQTGYEFEPLKNLTNNINATLSRISAAQENEAALTNYDRSTEMNHLIEMIGYPTLGVNMERMNIEAVSAHFEEETGLSSERILNQQVSDIDDQALKLNLQTLLDKVLKHPHEVASDALEFSGVEFQLSAKGVYGKDSLAYALVTFIPTQQPEPEAAS